MDGGRRWGRRGPGCGWADVAGVPGVGGWSLKCRRYWSSTAGGVALVVDQNPVGAFCSDAAHESLGVASSLAVCGVEWSRCRCFRWRTPRRTTRRTWRLGHGSGIGTGRPVPADQPRSYVPPGWSRRRSGGRSRRGYGRGGCGPPSRTGHRDDAGRWCRDGRNRWPAARRLEPAGSCASWCPVRAVPVPSWWW